MIDITPLDVRKKKGDFRRTMRGYDPAVVDDFLDLVAERLEDLVRENAALRERSTHLSNAVETFRERERAMTEALISAQQLREELRVQASRDAELLLREARAEANRVLDEAGREVEFVREAARRIQAQRISYLRSFRGLLERQLDEVEQEEERLRDVPRDEAEPTGRHMPVEDPDDMDISWLAAIEEERRP